MKKQIAWIFGGAAIVGLGMVGSLEACSGDDTKTDSGPAKDATTDTKGGNDVNTQDVVGNDTSPPQDAGADCKTPSGPFVTDSGPFCPFQVGPDGGTVFAACNDGQHCCLPGSGASTCSDTTCVFAVDASTNADFQCNETNDCASGSVCCENAGAEIQQDVGCTAYDFVSKQHGTSCVAAASCPTGQGQICGSNADCPTGKTCFPLNTKAIWLGVCISSDGGI